MIMKYFDKENAFLICSYEGIDPTFLMFSTLFS